MLCWMTTSLLIEWGLCQDWKREDNGEAKYEKEISHKKKFIKSSNVTKLFYTQADIATQFPQQYTKEQILLRLVSYIAFDSN